MKGKRETLRNDKISHDGFKKKLDITGRLRLGRVPNGCIFLENY